MSGAKLLAGGLRVCTVEEINILWLCSCCLFFSARVTFQSGWRK